VLDKSNLVAKLSVERNRITALLLAPTDVSLEAIEAWRIAILDDMDALKP
jgi:hypothetical protein